MQGEYMGRTRILHEPEEGVRTTSPLWRRVLHVLIGLMGWALIVWGWYHLGYGLGLPLFRFAFAAALGIVSVGLALTTIWVVHNFRIFQRKGERKGRRPAALNTQRDALGRQVVIPLQACRGASYVELIYTWDKKIYRPAPATELGTEALSAWERMESRPATATPLEVRVVEEVGRGHGLRADEQYQ